MIDKDFRTALLIVNDLIDMFSVYRRYYLIGDNQSMRAVLGRWRPWRHQS